MDAKQYVKELLDYAKYRVDHGCTKAEVDSLTRVLEQTLDLEGGIKDFADFFGVSESNVRTVISRKLIDKPRRRVYYPFLAFLKVVPQGWIRKRRGGLGKDRPQRPSSEDKFAKVDNP